MEKQSTNKPCFGIGLTSYHLFIDQEPHKTKKEFLIRSEMRHRMENLEDGYLSYQLHSEDIEAANGGMEPVWSLIDAQDIHQNMDVLDFDFSVHLKHNMAALTSLLEWSEKVYIKEFLQGLKKGSGADDEFGQKTKPTNKTFKIKMDLFPSTFMVQSEGKMKRVEAIIFGGKQPNLVRFQYDLYERDCMVIDFKKDKFVPFWINNHNDKEGRVVSITFDGPTQEVLPLRDFTVSDPESEFSPGPIATVENSELDLDLV